MNFMSLFGIVFAAEVIISPLGSDYDKPMKSFSEISHPVPVVLGVTYDETIHSQIVSIPSPTPTMTPSPTPTTIPTPSPTTTPPVREPVNTMPKIALLGDSMTDTLGPAQELIDQLMVTYPNLDPTILNYGVGGTNLDYGIERITHDYDYLGKHIPSLASRHPDIVVIESFGYNPYSFDDGAINKHWMALAHAVDTVRQTIPGAKIVIAVTIAPNSTVFADGAPGISFNAKEKQDHVNKIKEYLESTAKFALSQHLPLADAFHPSMGSDGNGLIGYINAGDHIHTSPEGRKFYSDILARTIIANKLLE